MVISAAYSAAFFKLCTVYVFEEPQIIQKQLLGATPQRVLPTTPSPQSGSPHFI